MNTFEKLLQSSTSEIQKVRSKIISEDAKFAVEEIVREESTILRNLERKKTSLTDVFPSSSLSLMVTKETFDATKWAKDLFNVNIEIALQKIKVEEAEKIEKE